MRYYINEHEIIDRFFDEYYFLSNYYPAVVTFDGITYFNSKAAYQAQKCRTSDERLRFAKLSANKAKSLGGSIKMREDWEDVKIPLMEEIVKAKFTQNPYLAEWLLNTGKKVLKEGNYWNDRFWGVDIRTGEGENHLGIILMELREIFRENGLPDDSFKSNFQSASFGKMKVVFGDITQSDCMCIVNAANSSLLGGGGVDGAIHQAAGPELLEECKTLDDCETGQAKITKGYRLTAEHMIHTVGPQYPMEDHEALLRQAYQNSLDLAQANCISSIAFPAISTGKYSYPMKEATEIAVNTVHRWITDHPKYEIDVVFVYMDI